MYLLIIYFIMLGLLLSAAGIVNIMNCREYYQQWPHVKLFKVGPYIVITLLIIYWTIPLWAPLGGK